MCSRVQQTALTSHCFPALNDNLVRQEYAQVAFMRRLENLSTVGQRTPSTSATPTRIVRASWERGSRRQCAVEGTPIAVTNKSKLHAREVHYCRVTQKCRRISPSVMLMSYTIVSTSGAPRITKSPTVGHATGVLPTPHARCVIMTASMWAGEGVITLLAQSRALSALIPSRQLQRVSDFCV
jgi:hypothetical protein